ncbi:hypothetical protein OH492_14385 [Vibrio chagasii]|nr:hypothetical protein [Vibrio chagasii]
MDSCSHTIAESKLFTAGDMTSAHMVVMKRGVLMMSFLWVVRLASSSIYAGAIVKRSRKSTLWSCCWNYRVFV